MLSLAGSVRRSAHLLAKVAIEGAIITLAFGLAFVLRSGIPVLLAERTELLQWLALLMGAQLVCLAGVTRYRERWRSTSLRNARPVFAAISIGSVAFAMLVQVTGPPGFPMGALVLEWLLALNLLLVVRFGARAWNVRRSMCGWQTPIRHPKRVLIVGAGVAGERIVRHMRENPKAGLQPIGYLDDDPAKCRRSIEGIPVLGPLKRLAAVVKDCAIDQVVIAIPSLPASRLGELLRSNDPRIKMTRVPSLPQLVSCDPISRLVRNVCLEDLLERRPIQVDSGSISAYLAGQRVLVTGAGGSIGSELCRQILDLRPAVLILLGHGENSLYWIAAELADRSDVPVVTVVADVVDRTRLERIFRQYRPDAVFHAAAHKHVPLMEQNAEEAVKNNVFGTRNLAEVALQFGVKTFVMISTDKAVSPSSVMGATKRVAEMVIQSFAQRIELASGGRYEVPTWGFGAVRPQDAVTRFTAVRFGNVLGSRGSVVPTMQRQITHGGPVTVTHPDMVRFFMTIPEAVLLVIQAGAMGRGGEVFVLDMGAPVRIMDLARNLILLNGLIPEVDIPIHISGIRPGEKLYEEVLTDEEGLSVTEHGLIHVARYGALSHRKLESDLERLRAAAWSGDEPGIRELLVDIVPQYQPGSISRACTPAFLPRLNETPNGKAAEPARPVAAASRSPRRHPEGPAVRRRAPELDGSD